MGIFETALQGIGALGDFIILVVGYDGAMELAQMAVEIGLAIAALALYLFMPSLKKQKSSNKEAIEKIDSAINRYEKVS